MLCTTNYGIAGPSWPWSHGSWIHNYLCNQCLMLWVWISIRVRCTTLCDKAYQWLTTGQWFSPGPPLSSTYKTDRHDIHVTEILLNTIKQTNKQKITVYYYFKVQRMFTYVLESVLSFSLKIFLSWLSNSPPNVQIKQNRKSRSTWSSLVSLLSANMAESRPRHDLKSPTNDSFTKGLE